MSIRKWSVGMAVLAAVLFFEAGAQAELITIDMVTVGNPGNAGEWSSGSTAYGTFPARICGAVDYNYQIGKYEVTAGQYTAFLNAVAKTDTYGLYDGAMWSDSWGCKIKQNNSSGSYTYTVASDYANRPVNWVTWGDAARFANWLHNGQPTGAQDVTTTENGSYYLNGATSNSALMAVTRKHQATWVIPTEDEWYKAAYHDKTAGIAATYFDYPTGTNVVPGTDTTEGTNPGNNANFSVSGDHEAVGGRYQRTPVGEFELSDSPYGTFDQGGNVWEWNDTDVAGYRGLRGGAFYDDESVLRASGGMGSGGYGHGYPTYETDGGIGFRVASVPPIPEPCTLIVWSLLGASGVGIGWWRRRREAA